MYSFKGKRVLVAGGTGLIGTPLAEFLLERGALVRVVSLDDPSRANQATEFLRRDLLQFDDCLEVCEGMEYIFNLLCVKGSPQTVRDRPAKMFEENLLLDVNLLRAARMTGVKGYLFASSLAVYGHSSVSVEGNVWSQNPSINDWYAGWAKRMGEMQIEAYRREFSWNALSVVRPANTYGPYDDFWSEGAMVVPSLIRRVVDGENPLRVWGTGLQVRDFIHAHDVARGMLFVAEKGIDEPVNLGSGMGFTIKLLVKIICDCVEVKPQIVWDASRPSGDQMRMLDTGRAKTFGFVPKISLEEGIRQTIAWYRANRDQHRTTRFDAFA